MIPSEVFCNVCGMANPQQSVLCSHCGSRLQATPATVGGAMELQPGHVLNQHYTVLDLVGHGGFGAVYKARDTRLNRDVAIKEMNQDTLSGADLIKAVDSFKREAQLLAALEHVHLPKIYETFDEGGRSYFVMAFIEGETLEKRLENLNGQPLPVEEVLDIGIKLCSVLDYLHTHQPQQIVFRDLKPANIMLTRSGQLYLIDFGIARHFKPGSKDTTKLGTPGYAAPEQHQGRTVPASDIYGLGATLYHLLSGKEPELFIQTPLKLNGTHPALIELEQLVMQMVQIDVQERPESAAKAKELLLRVYKMLKGQLQTSPSVPQGTLLFEYKEHGAQVSALAWSANGRFIASASHDRMVHVWNATNGTLLNPYKNHQRMVKAVAWSPDFRRVASAGLERHIQVWETVSSGGTLRFGGHTGAIEALAWSPHGRYIASADDTGVVQVWDAQTGRTAQTYKGHKDAVHALAWSPDSRYVASASDDETVQVWEALTGDVLVCYDEHENYVRAVSWSPDGAYLASGSWDDTVHVWSTMTTHPLQVYQDHGGMVRAVAWCPLPLTGLALLASADEQGEIHVWNGPTGETRFVYREHHAGITTIAWSPDGACIASADEDQAVLIWRAL